jgi:hypothetical protein
VKHEPAAALPPDIYDDDREFDEAIELSAERAGEMARGLTEIGREFPHIACPKRLVLIPVVGGMMVESELGVRWIIRRECSEHVALLNALIRPELLDARTAGSC